jgi:DNA-binding transcriptional ArsR family regulator
MRMLERRVHILLDDARYRRVAAAARERKTSVAAVIRDAIDQTLSIDPERKRAAADAILAAEPMEVPETVEELKAELRDARSGGR